MNPSRDEDRPWWLWPNLLGLDAPLVAIIWLAAIVKTTELSVVPISYAVLFLAVWSIYLVDRWLDARRPLEQAEDTLRHRFGRQHRRAFGGAAAFVAVIAIVLAALTLRKEVIVTGVIVGFLVGVYFLNFVVLPSLRSGSWLERLPVKEVGCGIGFALGTVASLGFDMVQPEVKIITAGMAALFTLNCLVISVADNVRQGRVFERSILLMAVALATIFSLRAFGGGSALDHSIGTSALFLAGLFGARTSMRPRLVRVLADVALLTPLGIIIFPSIP